MKEVTRGALVLANSIALEYNGTPEVRAIMVGGSVARGCADEYSDLEIGVVWAETPAPRVRRAAIERVGGELWSFDREPGHELYGLREVVVNGRRYVGTAMISTHHLIEAEVEQCLMAVLDGLDTTASKQALLAAIQQGVPLHGAKLLAEWRARASEYPAELAIKVVQENLWFGPWFRPEAYAARDDRLVLYQHYLWVAQCLLRVLAGLNRLYYPSPEHKWMDALIGAMRLAPQNLSGRLKQVFREEPLQGWYALKDLIDETITLLNVHLPAVDTVALFTKHPEVNLAWARRRWQPEAPYSLMHTMGLTTGDAG